MSALGSRIRFVIGKGFCRSLDYLLTRGLFPFGTRFPVGLRFSHDLNRFLGGPPQTMLDVGANVGQTALAFARAWPRTEIHSFEPVRDTFDRLRARCAGNPRIHCHRFALGAAPGELVIQLQSDSELNSLLAPMSAEAGVGERVEIRCLDEVAAGIGIDRVDLLKMDAEGFEMEVLRGATGLLHQRRIRAVLSECRFIRNDTRQVLFEDLDRALCAAGFRFSGVYEIYRWGPAKAFAAFGNGFWLLDES